MGKQREPAITFRIRGALALLIIKVHWSNVRQQPSAERKCKGFISFRRLYTPLLHECSAYAHVNGVRVEKGLQGISVP